jgi:Peptidase family S41
MMKIFKLFCILFILLKSSITFSQEKSKLLVIFDSVVVTTESQYIGYFFYVNDSTRKSYKSNLSKIRDAISNLSYPIIAAISDYLNWFKDKHLSYSANNFDDDVKYIPKYNIKNLRKCVGIWKHPNVNFYVKIYIEKGQLKGKVVYDYRNYVDTTKVYLKFVETYSDHQYNLLQFAHGKASGYPINIINDKIISNGEVKFIKVKTIDISNRTSKSKMNSATNFIDFRIVDSNTTYLRLTNFYDLTYDSLNRFLARFNNEITSKENFGGSIIPSFAIAKYVSIGKIDYISGYVLANDSLIKYTEEYCALSSEISEYNKMHCSKYLKMLKANRNKIFEDTMRLYNEVHDLPYPSKVAILANEYTSSAAEMMIFSFKRSKKVKLFGTYTNGAFDTADANYFDIDDNNFGLYLPAELHSPSLTRRYDYIGIKPDYFIDFKKSNYMDAVINILKTVK